MRRTLAALVPLLLATPALAGGLPVLAHSGPVYDGFGGPLDSQFVHVFDQTAFVPVGETLTVDNAILKFGGGVGWDQLRVSGTLLATDSIFTSGAEDLGGDTNGLGVAPVTGDWRGISIDFNSSGSRLEGCEIRYADSAITVSASDVVILDGAFSFNGNGSDPVVNLFANSAAEIRDSTFADNLSIPVGRIPAQQIGNMSGNVSFGNTPGNYFSIDANRAGADTSGDLTAPLTLTTRNYPGDVLVVRGRIELESGSSLTVGPGVVIKFDADLQPGVLQYPGRIEVRTSGSASGELHMQGTGSHPIVLTSLHDDYLEDTNQDGGATLPAPDDIDGLRVPELTPAVTGSIEHVEVRYGGGVTVAAVEVRSEDVRVHSVRADRSGSDGFLFRSAQGDLENLMATRSNGDGIEVTWSFPSVTDDFRIVHATLADNAGYGLNAPSFWVGSVVNSLLHGNALGNVGPNVQDTQVFSSFGAFGGVHGNLVGDPLFGASDRMDGYALTDGSPAMDAADPLAAPLLSTDYLSGSRRTDGNASLQALPDMGAVELAHVALHSEGEAILGQAVTLGLVSNAGIAEVGAGALFYGFLNGSTFVPGLGWFHAGPATQIGVFSVVTIDATTIDLLIPDDPGLAGIPLGIQSYVVFGAGGRTPEMTNRWEGVLTQI